MRARGPRLRASAETSHRKRLSSSRGTLPALSEVAGIHLLQGLELVATPRRSAVARLDAAGRLTALDLAATDDEIAALVEGADLGAVAVDAPLHVPNETGRRDCEAVLAWCDVAAFPSSRRRLAQVHGGLRGEALAPRLAAPGRAVLEALPDQVLRQIAWEREHPPDAPADRPARVPDRLDRRPRAGLPAQGDGPRAPGWRPSPPGGC